MSGKNIEEVRTDGTGAAEPGAGTSTESTSAENTGTTGRGRGRRGRKPAEPGTEPQKKLLGMATLDADADTEAEAKREERNRKRRERYAANKNKPKKVKKSDVVNTTDIANIINAISSTVAKRPELVHWQLTPDEINKIANPLANIISTSGILTEMGQHSDAIALTIACFTAFVPRIGISYANYKIKKEINHAGSNTLFNGAGEKRARQKIENRESDNRGDGNAAGTAETASNDELYIGAVVA